mgnify:CR=1 FL=1
MKPYYVNKKAQSNGDHEVHTSECKFLQIAGSKTYLGLFLSCKEAVVNAKKTYKESNGCYYCCNECHTK